MNFKNMVYRKETSFNLILDELLEVSSHWLVTGPKSHYWFSVMSEGQMHRTLQVRGKLTHIGKQTKAGAVKQDGWFGKTLGPWSEGC